MFLVIFLQSIKRERSQEIHKKSGKNRISDAEQLKLISVSHSTPKKKTIIKEKKDTFFLTKLKYKFYFFPFLSIYISIYYHLSICICLLFFYLFISIYSLSIYLYPFNTI